MVDDIIAAISGITVFLVFSQVFFFNVFPKCCNMIFFLAFPRVNHPLLESTLIFFVFQNIVSHNISIIKNDINFL